MSSHFKYDLLVKYDGFPVEGEIQWQSMITLSIWV